MNDCVLVYCERGERFDTKVLFVLKDRPAWQRGKLNLVGGKIEEGESPEQAAFRELLEETGYGAETVQQQGILQGHDTKIHCFRAYGFGAYSDQPPKGRPGETECPQWLHWNDAKNDPRLIPNLRVIVPLFHCRVRDWRVDDAVRSEGGKTHTFSVTMPTYAD